MENIQSNIGISVDDVYKLSEGRIHVESDLIQLLEGTYVDHQSILSAMNSLGIRNLAISTHKESGIENSTRKSTFPAGWSTDLVVRIDPGTSDQTNLIREIDETLKTYTKLRIGLKSLEDIPGILAGEEDYNPVLYLRITSSLILYSIILYSFNLAVQGVPWNQSIIHGAAAYALLQLLDYSEARLNNIPQFRYDLFPQSILPIMNIFLGLYRLDHLQTFIVPNETEDDVEEQ